MKKKEKKHRFALTLMLSSLVFVVLLATMSIVVLALSIMVRLEIFSDLNPDSPGTTLLIVLSAVASIIIGTALSTLIGKIPLKPVNSIMNTLNRLASGDYKARLPVRNFTSKLPVISEITDSFNTMASELDNTEMLRSDFINNFSHEFKTPIVSIAGFARLLKKENLTEAQKTEYLNIIEEESMRLSHIATNVLNLTKVENQQILTNTTLFNLSEQLRTCVLLLENKWEEKSISFQMDIGEHMISGNEELLKQMWINLIDNAIKFSPTGETVEICIKKPSSCIEVSITNKGPEISEEDKKRIFSKFFQADKSHAAQGSGVGLAIVKKVAQLHDGTVEAESRQGKNIFTVILPVK